MSLQDEKLTGRRKGSKQFQIKELDEEMEMLKILQQQAKIVPDGHNNISKISKLTPIQIINKLYDQQDIKLQIKIKKMREMLSEGKSMRQKTFAEENLEELETRVTKNFVKNR